MRNSHYKLALIVIISCCLSGFGVVAQDSKAEGARLVLVNATSRINQDLSGSWAYSIDPYRTGQFDIHGNIASGNALRFKDVNVAEESKNPKTLYEFDFDHAPRVDLPGAWNQADSSLRYFDGLMWYQRHFEASPNADQRNFLHFEAVNYHAYVYLNGQFIGEHEGGFTPFSFEVTKVLRTGDNQITLGVDSLHSNQSIPPKVTDWDLYGGVTRPIQLISTPNNFIDDEFIRLTSDRHIVADVRLNGPNIGGQVVAIVIEKLKLRLKSTTDKDGVAHFDIKAPMGLKLWSPEHPNLYDIRIETANDSLFDRVSFRTIEVKSDKILLNGKSIFLRGISMHEEELGDNPARKMTYENAKALLSEIKYGLHGNYVRLSHYPHAEVMTRLADEMGLLVWSEIPVYWAIDFKSPKTLNQAKSMMTENILRDRNRASVIIWSIANETPVSDERNAFLTELIVTTKGLDNTRLVSAALFASRKTVNGRQEITLDDPMIDRLDIMSVNTYNGWYSDDDLSALPSFIWKAPRIKPLILSEFGADALSNNHVTINSPKFSEEYQNEYYIQTLAMADKIPFLRGMSPWILKDFRSPRRQHPIYQKGWNRKGLMSETGVKKMAFKTLEQYYTKKAKTSN